MTRAEDLAPFDPGQLHLSRAQLRGLPELRELQILAEHALAGGVTRPQLVTLAELEYGGECFPIVAFRFGPADPSLPVLALFGGVHGLERIGTRVVLAYLRTLIELARWDRLTQTLLTETRLWVVPLVNPVGMYLRRRSNGNRVDLMRNAPVRAEGLAAWHLFGGQRFWSGLPWYMGRAGAPLQPEAQAVADLVVRELFPSRLALSLDVHSGYGQVDRLWFPYAKSREPYPDLAAVMILHHLLERAHPNHVYRLEPQSREYLAHGDLWDYLYDGYRQSGAGGLYLPLTLELGSWLWVKKNWIQAFSALGVFNPRLPHRERRALRRHLFLFDLLHRSVHSPALWLDHDAAATEHLHRQGLRLWYAADPW